jgi:hypothetical protein
MTLGEQKNALIKNHATYRLWIIQKKTLSSNFSRGDN